MRVSKDQYRMLTEAHSEAKHIGTMLDDLREGVGHPTDLDKIRKSMLRLHAYLGQCDLAFTPKRLVHKGEDITVNPPPMPTSDTLL